MQISILYLRGNGGKLMFDEVTQLLMDTINGEFSRDNEKREPEK